MWLATTCVLILNIITKGKQPCLYDIFLNYTTLFGFIAPDHYISAGAWSIGNEMVFYSVTPLLLLLYKKNKRIGNLFVLFQWLIAAAISYFFLFSNKTIVTQWSVYINPFNQFYLFSSGIMLYYNFSTLKITNSILFILLFFVVLTFVLIPSGVDRITLVMGWNRIIFSLLSTLLVFFFWKFDFNLSLKLAQFLSTLGIVSYGIYLLHPLVLQSVDYVLSEIHFYNSYLAIAITIPLTFVISRLSYQYYEKIFINMGKQLSVN